jgi:carbonic anhydrase
MIPEKRTGMSDFGHIFENNRAWVARKLAADPEFFVRLAKGQQPQLLYIGCSDSRVTAEEIMGVDPGELFVHRNIANLAIPTDGNVNAVVQYAIEHLRVKHIIVCGHYECGGVRAALHPADLGQLNGWLQTLRDAYRLHRDELDAIADQQQRFDRLVEINVLEQCINIIKIDHWQRSWYKTGSPMVHGWVFDLRSGLLKDLALDLPKEMADIRAIYDLKPLG